MRRHGTARLSCCVKNDADARTLRHMPGVVWRRQAAIELARSGHSPIPSFYYFSHVVAASAVMRSPFLYPDPKTLERPVDLPVKRFPVNRMLKNLVFMSMG